MSKRKKKADRTITIRYAEPSESDLRYGDDPRWTVVIAAHDAKRLRTHSLRLSRSEAKQLQRELGWSMPEPARLNRRSES